MAKRVIAAGDFNDSFVRRQQAQRGFTRTLVSQTVGQREVRSDLPLILTVEVNVEPIVVIDRFTAGQWLVDVCGFGKVIHKRVQRRIAEQAANGREEEALNAVLDDVGAEL